jgi:hypothetical protein
MEWHQAHKNFKSLQEIKGTVNNILAPDVLTKAYPAAPVLANSKLVTQSL